MNKCICDICCDKPAANKFKVKQYKPIVRNGFHGQSWVKLDICESCYRKLISIHNDKSTEDLIMDFVCTDEHLKRYEDVDMQSAYLDGFQKVIDLLVQNRIIKGK